MKEDASEVVCSLQYLSGVVNKQKCLFMLWLQGKIKAKVMCPGSMCCVRIQKKYAIAVKSWENNWEDLATFFNYPAEVRRLIYTANAIEGYNRGLRKVIKTKASFPTPEAARKLLYLANQNITRKWGPEGSPPMQNWANILNQLAGALRARFAGRMSI